MSGAQERRTHELVESLEAEIEQLQSQLSGVEQQDRDIKIKIEALRSQILSIKMSDSY